MDNVPYDDPVFAEELGRTIRLLRIDRRLERRDLADQAGISYSYLSAIENGGKSPSARLLYTLARALGVRDDELLTMVRERMQPGRPVTRAPVPPAAPAPMAAAPAAPMAAAPATAAAAPEEPRRRLGRRRRPQTAAEAQELAELLSQLDPDDAAAVIDLARRLAGK